MKWFPIVLVASIIGIAQPASACLIADDQEALIHSALPSVIPSDAVALEVTIETGDPASLYGEGLRVHVRRVIQGEFHSSELSMRTSIETSCHAPFANGSAGLILGYLIVEGSTQTISPVFVRRGDGFQIPTEGPVKPRPAS